MTYIYTLALISIFIQCVVLLKYSITQFTKLKQKKIVSKSVLFLNFHSNDNSKKDEKTKKKYHDLFLFTNEVFFFIFVLQVVAKNVKNVNRGSHPTNETEKKSLSC
jgi:hypothetical protein